MEIVFSYDLVNKTAGASPLTRSKTPDKTPFYVAPRNAKIEYKHCLNVS